MRKWLLLVSVALINALSAYSFASISTIPNKAEDYYDVSSLEINLFVQIFFILYVLLAPFVPWLISTGYRKSMLISIALMLLGTWIKVISSDNFWGGLIGQGLIAGAPPILLTSLPTLAELWFPRAQSLLVLTIGELSPFLGMATCFLIAPEISVFTNSLIQAGSMTAVSFLFLFVIQKDPVEQERLNFALFFREIKSVITEDSLLFFLVLGVAGITGISYSFLGLIGEALEDEDIQSKQASVVAFLFAGLGMVGGFTVTVLQHKKVSENLTFCIFATGTIISMLLWCFLAGVEIANYFIGPVVGFFFFGLIPLGLKRTIEYNPQLKETVPSGLTLILAQTFGLVFTYPITYAGNMNLHSLWVIFGLLFIITIPLVGIVIKSEQKKEIDKELMMKICSDES